jgi:branched-subunit amino acid aminotransferase/4-amino-4-deoxychorismate lyase
VKFEQFVLVNFENAAKKTENIPPFLPYSAQVTYNKNSWTALSTMGTITETGTANFQFQKSLQ